MPKKEKPVCPHCGNDEFREDQTIGAEQSIVWDEEKQKYERSSTRYYKNEIKVVGFECARCDKPVPFEDFKEWISK